MVGRVFNLERMRGLLRSQQQQVTVIALIAIPTGTAFIAMAPTTFYLERSGTLLVGGTALVLAIPIALYIKQKITSIIDRMLRKTVSENLFDNGLMALAMQDDAAERLPSLMVRQGPYTRKVSPPKTLEEKLGRLAWEYPKICREAGLCAYPRSYYYLVRALQVSGILFLITTITLQCLYDDPGQLKFLPPIFSGIFFYLMGLFQLCALQYNMIVSEEVIVAKSQEVSE